MAECILYVKSEKNKGLPCDALPLGAFLENGDGESIVPGHPQFSRRILPIMKWKWRFPFEWPTREQVTDGYGNLQYRINPRLSKKKISFPEDHPGHLLVMGPCRTWKSAGVVLPALLSWQGSVIVNDPSGDNWKFSAGFRQSIGQTVFKFCPANDGEIDGCHSWNPLGEIRIYSHDDVHDAMALMKCLYDACTISFDALIGDSARNDIENLLACVALHLIYSKTVSATLVNMAACLEQHHDIDVLWNDMQTTNHHPANGLEWKDSKGIATNTHPFVAEMARFFLAKSLNDQMRIAAEARRLLSVFEHPVIVKNTSESQFLLRELKSSEKPVSLYYSVSPWENERTAALSRLFWAMAMRQNSLETGAPAAHSLLFVMDDILSIGELAELPAMLASKHSQTNKFLLVCQDPHQLAITYGDPNIFIKLFKVRIYCRPNCHGAAKFIESAIEHQWTANELLSMNDREIIIHFAGTSPIYGLSIGFFEDATFFCRSKILMSTGM